MRILLVQTSFLGDTVLSTPVIAALRELHPQAEIWMMTTPVGAELVKRDPNLAGVIPFDKNRSERGLGAFFRKAKYLRSLKFDRAYALQRSARTTLLLAFAQIPYRVGFQSARLSFLYHRREKRDSSLHDVLRNLSLLSAERAIAHLPQELNLVPATPDQLSPWVRDLLANSHPFIVLVPGSAWATKRWDAQHYRTVAQHFSAKNYRVFVLGDAQEREIAEVVCHETKALNLAAKTSLSELLSIIQRASLLVCNDSSTLHMASAFKIPTVAIFCATSPTFGFGPWKNHAVVEELRELSCKPCSRHGGALCPTGTEACMKDLLPVRVIRAAEALLRGDNKANIG